jgi:hypothetical protein
MATTKEKMSKLNGSEANAKSSNLMFPSDLLGDNQDKLCMTFFINKIRGAQANITFRGGLTTTKNTLSSPYGEIPVIHTVSRGLQGGKIKDLSSTFERSNQSITLPMPKNLNFSTTANWTTTELGAAGMALDQGSDFAKASGGGKELLEQLGYNMLGSIASQYAKGNIKGKEFAQLATRTVANNYSETLFKNVSNRSFNFSWTLTPRNQKEADDIDTILRVFRFHQLPEFKENVGNGNAFLLYPSSVDIVFWENGTVNSYIPRISTCAITNIETNYSPTGTFIKTTSGTPQSYTLTLSLTELSLLHKGMVGTDPSNSNSTF